ncbi:MAG: hypothetical protein K5663_09230 [Clostridiales bacterium]|nr:hypothetical protein [Clostridiales bacterium]
MSGFLSTELACGIQVRSLIRLALLAAYAAVLLRGMKRSSKKRIRLLKILCAACAGMGLAEIVLHFTAPGSWINREQAYPCGLFAGFWLGAYIGSGRKWTRLGKYARRRLFLQMLLACAYVSMYDIPGRTSESLIGYTDSLGLHRILTSFSAALALAVLTFTVIAASCVAKEKFKPDPVCCWALFNAVILPFYALSDSFHIKVLGLDIDMFIGGACLAVLLLIYANRKTKDSCLPPMLKAAAFALSLLPVALIMPLTANGFFWTAIILGTLSIAVLMSPLFPFFKCQGRANNRSIKRKYS